MDINQTDLITMLISVLCGSLLGIEREYQNKSAGLRTIVLICLGSTVFTIISQRLGASDDRIAANIITGIGFIGAGVIFKEHFDVKGLTTAAVIWISAAIGMVIGIGDYQLGLILSVIVLIVLSGFAKVEMLMDFINHKGTYTITFIDNDVKHVRVITDLVLSEGLKPKMTHLSKINGRLRVHLEVRGNLKRLRALTEKLLMIPDIQEMQH